MNFSDFTKQKIEKQGDEKKEKKFTEEDARKTYDELKDMNSDQLSQRLFSEVAKQKQNGTFNYDMLSKSVDGIKNFLPPETYVNIKKMLDNLR